ncbi:MAG: Verru_Chthon cassette protein D [Prosthecobacter sp.]|nr:Verru_Chthon cassette protein D [Prosthecobacter sp.]MDI1312760.1 Verru_Chthon cassette protein D [Prosthecobacter sp.]
MASATPALMRTMQATRLSSTGDSIMGALTEAKQLAYAQNVPVELRFFKYPDPDFPGSSVQLFRSYQSFKIVTLTDGTGANAQTKESVVPVGTLSKLSDGIIIAADQELSPLLNGQSGQALDDVKTSSSGGAGYSGVANAKYNAIRFMPDGSCRKVSAQNDGFSQLDYGTLPTSFLTITYNNGQEITTGNLPKNFYTIQIDPFTGKARNYRPGF